MAPGRRKTLRLGGARHLAAAVCLRRFVCTALVLPIGGCGALSHGFLAAAGPVAAAERHEFYVVCAIMVFVVGPVLLLTPLIAWHYRLSNTHTAFRPEWGFSWLLEALIWIPPTGIMVLLSVLLWTNTHQLDPYRPLAGGPPLQIQVVSLDWKWIFIYPAEHIATADALIIPAGRPLHLSLTSDTVMQSFFIPRLASQIYAMADMTTQLNLAASKPGHWKGENTQYNGKGFQKQSFDVRALEPADFVAWVSKTQAEPATLNDAVFTQLTARSVLPHPLTFGDVQPGLFARIVAGALPPVLDGDSADQANHG